MNLQEYLKIPGNFDTFYNNIIENPDTYKNFWQIIFYSVLNNLSDIRAENIVINLECPEKMTIIDRVLLHFENYMLHIMHDTKWQHISFLDFLLINFIALNKFYLYNFDNGKELYEESFSVPVKGFKGEIKVDILVQALGRINYARISEKDKENIFYNNAKINFSKQFKNI